MTCAKNFFFIQSLALNKRQLKKKSYLLWDVGLLSVIYQLVFSLASKGLNELKALGLQKGTESSGQVFSQGSMIPLHGLGSTICSPHDEGWRLALLMSFVLVLKAWVVH